MRRRNSIRQGALVDDLALGGGVDHRMVRTLSLRTGIAGSGFSWVGVAGGGPDSMSMTQGACGRSGMRGRGA